MTDRELVERGLLEDDVRACEQHCAELERELAEARAQLAGAVPVAELRHLVGLCETYARGDGDVTRDVLDALREFVAIVERRAGVGERERRPNWQCSGCGWGFDGAWKKTCPCCDREHYWTGSVFPKARRWDGSRGTRVKADGGAP